MGEGGSGKICGTYPEIICRASFGTHPQILSRNAIFSSIFSRPTHLFHKIASSLGHLPTTEYRCSSFDLLYPLIISLSVISPPPPPLQHIYYSLDMDLYNLNNLNNICLNIICSLQLVRQLVQGVLAWAVM